MDTPTPAPSKCHYCGGIWADCDCMHPEIVAPAPAVSGQTPTKLKMADIRVGMTLRDPDDYYFQQSGVLTVTAITDRGFRYDAERGYSLGARYGFVEAKGREHFGLPDGECRYIPVSLPSAPVASAPKDETNDLSRGGKWGHPCADLPRRNNGDK